MSLTLRDRRKGQKLLNSVIDYLYEQSQDCQTIDEGIPLKLALAICGAVRRGEERPLEAACYASFGKSLESYTRMRMKEKFQQAYELRLTIPDFDPEAVPDGRRDMDIAPGPRAVPTPIRKEAERKHPNVHKQVGAG